MAGNNNRFNNIFMQVQAETGMPADILFAIAMLESSMNPFAVGDGGQSHGLFQIYRSAHPDISVEQAQDPYFAAKWTAKNFMAAYNRFGSYEAAIIHHNHPVGAAHYANTGSYLTSKNQWYLQTALGYQANWTGGETTDIPITGHGDPPPDVQANGQQQGDWDITPDFSEFPDITEAEFREMLGEPVVGTQGQELDMAQTLPGSITEYTSGFEMSEGQPVSSIQETEPTIEEEVATEYDSRPEPNVPPRATVLAASQAEEEEEVG